jgi:hypothetical protein
MPSNAQTRSNPGNLFFGSTTNVASAASFCRSLLRRQLLCANSRTTVPGKSLSRGLRRRTHDASANMIGFLPADAPFRWSLKRVGMAMRGIGSTEGSCPVGRNASAFGQPSRRRGNNELLDDTSLACTDDEPPARRRASHLATAMSQLKLSANVRAAADRVLSRSGSSKSACSTEAA